METSRRRWVLGGCAVVALVLGVSACVGGAPPAEGPPSPRSSADLAVGACVLDRVAMTVADGVYAYIEPEDLLQVGSSYVVVGSPSYTWTPGMPGDSLPLTRDRHLAARFGLDGRATLIERPVQDSIGSVRSLVLGDERWGVLFDVERRGAEEIGWDTIALWYAEHDGRGWSLLEPVPMPGDGDVDIDASSELVRVADELVWVVPVLRPNGTSEVVEYSRRDGRWQHRVIGDDWVTRSSLAHDPGSGLWMVRSGPNAERTAAALRLYRRDADWRIVRDVHELRGGDMALDLAISFPPDGLTVTWRMMGGVDTGAYALVGTGPGSQGTLLHLDRPALQVLPLGQGDDRPRWLVSVVDEAARRVDLRVVGPRSLFGAERLASAPNPFPAFLAALARTPEEAIAVGADLSFDPAHPFVRSLVLRLSTSCT